MIFRLTAANGTAPKNNQLGRRALSCYVGFKAARRENGLIYGGYQDCQWARPLKPLKTFFCRKSGKLFPLLLKFEHHAAEGASIGGKASTQNELMGDGSRHAQPGSRMAAGSAAESLPRARPTPGKTVAPCSSAYRHFSGRLGPSKPLRPEWPRGYMGRLCAPQ